MVKTKIADKIILITKENMELTVKPVKFSSDPRTSMK